MIENLDYKNEGSENSYDPERDVSKSDDNISLSSLEDANISELLKDPQELENINSPEHTCPEKSELLEKIDSPENDMNEDQDFTSLSSFEELENINSPEHSCTEKSEVIEKTDSPKHFGKGELELESVSSPIRSEVIGIENRCSEFENINSPEHNCPEKSEVLEKIDSPNTFGKGVLELESVSSPMKSEGIGIEDLCTEFEIINSPEHSSPEKSVVPEKLKRCTEFEVINSPEHSSPLKSQRSTEFEIINSPEHSSPEKSEMLEKIDSPENNMNDDDISLSSLEDAKFPDSFGNKSDDDIGSPEHNIEFLD